MDKTRIERTLSTLNSLLDQPKSTPISSIVDIVPHGGERSVTVIVIGNSEDDIEKMFEQMGLVKKEKYEARDKDVCDALEG